MFRAGDATSALRELNRRTIDAIFLDINMPGLSGIELAGVLANFSHRPVVVSLRPTTTRPSPPSTSAPSTTCSSRSAKTASTRRSQGDRGAPSDPADRAANDDSDVIPAELSGVTHLVPRDSIGWVEAEGDYARLHSSSGAHLVRIR